VKARVGDYLLEVNGVPVTTRDEPWKALDGTAERQTILRLSDRASGERGVERDRRSGALRDQLRAARVGRGQSSPRGLALRGKLAYVWVPNTAGRRSRPSTATTSRSRIARAP
jgi:tricorn protease